MAYVRSLLSECELDNGGAIRHYSAEVPVSSRGQDDRFGYKLITLELWLSPGAVTYYADTPYALAENIWMNRMATKCCPPFRCYSAEECWENYICRNEDVLYYRESPIVKERNSISWWKPPAPIIFSVSTGYDRIAKEFGMPIDCVMEALEYEHRLGNRLDARQLKHSMLDRLGVPRYPMTVRYQMFGSPRLHWLKMLEEYQSEVGSL